MYLKLSKFCESHIQMELMLQVRKLLGREVSYKRKFGCLCNQLFWRAFIRFGLFQGSQRSTFFLEKDRLRVIFDRYV